MESAVRGPGAPWGEPWGCRESCGVWRGTSLGVRFSRGPNRVHRSFQQDLLLVGVVFEVRDFGDTRRNEGRTGQGPFEDCTKRLSSIRYFLTVPSLPVREGVRPCVRRPVGGY